MTERYKPDPKGGRTQQALARLYAIGLEHRQNHSGEVLDPRLVAAKIGYSERRTVSLYEVVTAQSDGTLPHMSRTRLKKNGPVRRNS